MAKPAQTPAESVKKRRFSARSISFTAPTKSAGGNDNNGDGSELVATIRRWGTTFGVFDDGSRTEALWQLQVVHGGRQAFGYHLLTVCKEALQQHPDERVRDPLQLEAELHIKVLNGAPPHGSAADPDGVGLEPWHPVIYAPTPTDGMNIIHFIMQHKVSTGHLLQMPKLIALFPQEQEATAVPAAWVLKTEHVLQAATFRALPPRGRRHVLMQVEMARPDEEPRSIPANQETPSSQDGGGSPTSRNEDQSYHILIFGGIYGLRELFEAANIQGGLVPQPDAAKDEYVRHLKTTLSEENLAKLATILEQVLLRIPVYLIDRTENENDPLVSWLLREPSVHLGERSSRAD